MPTRMATDKQKPRRINPFCWFFLKMLLEVFKFVRYYIDLVIDFLFGLYYHPSKKRVLPPATNPIILESATSLAKKIRKRELKCEEVVQAFIGRCKEVNDIINAIVDERFDEALKEARQIDKDLETGQILDVDFREKPFLGIPFTTKESTACKGMSSTFGLKVRRNKKASEDAEVVDLMKKSGGILLGVTNVPPLNMWMETTNPVFGTTNNPYDTRKNVGGSSGGEASLLAAGGTAIGIGSDIGGSIRIPAFSCGVFGHKPTSHLVSTRGLTFRTGKEVATIVVAGPMTRYAEDIIPFFKVLLGPNVDKLKLNQDVDVKNVKICYVEDPEDPFVSSIREETKKMFARVVDHFGEVCSQKPEKVNFSGLRYAGRLWKYWMSQEENANFRRDLTDRQGELSPIKEFFKYIVGCSDHIWPTIMIMLNSKLPNPDPEWTKAETEKLKQQIIDKLGPNGVLLYQSAPFPASYHNAVFLRPWNFNFFNIWNSLKFPVTQVPLGLSEEGMPLGIQVVAAPYNDHLTIAVARHLEKQFGGYVPSFKNQGCN